MFIQRLEDKFGTDTPIFAEEIIALFGEYTRAYVFRLINQAVRDGTLSCFSRGVYYIPRPSFFGKSTICSEMVAEKRYLNSDGEVYGVYAGLNLLNRFGLTTQVPNTPEIVTNNEATRKRKITIEGRAFILRKARCKITKENYPAYTLLQLFCDMDDSDVIDAFSKKQINDFVARNKVKAEDLLSMAMFFPAVTLKKMVRSGMIKEIM